MNLGFLLQVESKGLDHRCFVMLIHHEIFLSSVLLKFLKKVSLFVLDSFLANSQVPSMKGIEVNMGDTMRNS